MSEEAHPYSATADGRHRRGRERRRVARAGLGAPVVRLGQDPLKRHDSASIAQLAALVVGALIAHGALLFGAGMVASAFATEKKPSVAEPVIVRFEAMEPEVPKAATPIQKTAAPTVSENPKVREELSPPIKVKTKARKRRVKRRSVAKKPNPVPLQPSTAPRRIVGANLGSTVQGGNGPVIAIGNALDGHSGTAAQAPVPYRRPAKTQPAPRTKTKPYSGRGNRIARALPQKGITLTKPKRSQKVTPTYPPLLKAQGIEANVIVEVEITATGSVQGVAIVAPAKQREFNLAAKAAALKEKFKPATRNGVAVAYRLTFTYRYRISS